MKLKYLQNLLITAFLFFGFITFSNAKHIIGGEASYKLISSDKKLGGTATYEIKFIIYRDVYGGGAEFDNPGYFGIFRSDPNGWVFYKRYNISIKNVAYIRNVLNECVVAPKELLYEKGEYKFTVKLPIVDATYRFTYQRCCRTEEIVNIVSPKSTGATYSVDITPEAQLLGNSSPIVTAFPPTVLCVDSYFEFDHSATDSDGDSLAYEFFTPLNGGGLAGTLPGTENQKNNCNGIIPLPDNCTPPYPEVVFKNPYTFDSPILGSTNLTIDSFTGILSGKPSGYGHYVVGVKVKEYRNGILIGTVKRDFQFFVTNCTPAVNAVVGNGVQVDISQFDVIACGKDTVTFVNNSYIKSKIKNVYWEFEVGDTIATSTEWHGKIAFPGVGKYSGKLVLNKGGNCLDSTNINVEIFPGVYSVFDYEFDSCSTAPVLFRDKSYSYGGDILKWGWNFGDGTISTDANPLKKYTNPGFYRTQLIVEDENTCKDTISRILNYFPIPSEIVVKPSNYLGCVPSTIIFKNTTKPFIDSYKIFWDFGDGEIDTLFNPIHTFTKPGIYSVGIRIVAPNKCSIESSYSDLIEIRESPIADFEFKPTSPNITNPRVDFTNNSQNAKVYFWDFKTGDISYDFEPTYNFPDTGSYKVMMIATHENHCTDTIIKEININSDIQIFFPNAFTPNGDGTNDEFFGKSLYPRYIYNYNMTIWDRWGGLVYKTDSPTGRWYGSKFNSGGILPQGVYVYKYSYNSPNGKLFKGKGFVTIVK